MGYGIFDVLRETFTSEGRKDHARELGRSHRAMDFKDLAWMKEPPFEQGTPEYEEYQKGLREGQEKKEFW